MNSLFWFTERFAEISTIILHIFFLYHAMHPKISRKNQVIAIILFVIVRMAYFGFGFDYRPYFAVISAIVWACFVFEGGFRKYIVWNVLTVVIDGIIDATVLSVYLLFPNTSLETAVSLSIERSFMIIISRALLFLAYNITVKQVDKDDIISGWVCVLILLVPIGCWILLESLIKYNFELHAVTFRLQMAISSYALLLIIISVVILYQRITAEGKELARSKLELRVAEMTETHISEVTSLYSVLSSVRHDLKNHFAVIKGLLDANKYDDLQEYIAGFIDLNIEMIDYINHPILNVLVSSRASLAKERDIDLTTDIVLPNEIPINDVDLCILISNLLDNAFEACVNAFVPRYINLSTRIENSHWVVACRNSVRTEGDFTTSKYIKSTKKSAGMHGIGTRQINDIAEKTGGFVVYKHKNHEFSTLIMLKLKNNQNDAS